MRITIHVFAIMIKNHQILIASSADCSHEDARICSRSLEHPSPSKSAEVDRRREARIVEGLTPGVSPGACKPRPLPADFFSLICKQLTFICGYLKC